MEPKYKSHLNQHNGLFIRKCCERGRGWGGVWSRSGAGLWLNA